MTGQLNPESLNDGHHWIEQTAKDQATLRKLQIEIRGWVDASKWHTPDESRQQRIEDRQALCFDTGGKRQSIEFATSLIEDCADEEYDKVHRGKALAIIQEQIAKL